jgi:hypothetical protein
MTHQGSLEQWRLVQRDGIPHFPKSEDSGHSDSDSQRTRLLAVFIVLSCLSSTLASAQITNGSFEDGASGWTFMGGLTIGGPPDLPPAVGVDGSRVASIGGGDIPNSTLSQTFPVVSGTSYVLSLATAAFGDNFPGRVGSVRVDLIAPDNSVLASQSSTNVSPALSIGTNGFTRHAILFSTPDGVSAVTLRITDTSPNGGVAVDMMIDDVRIDQQATPNPENLVANGSFEFPLLASGANHVVPAGELAPWQTTEDSFLIWGPVLPNELAADGRQHLEVVSVWQTVTTIAGEDYRLRYYHSPRPGVDSTLSVEINGRVIRTFAENGTALTGFNWQRFRTNFTATSNSTTIRFDGIGIAGNAHIDNVVLERLPASSTLRVSEVELCWETVGTKLYQPQYRSVLTANTWTALGPEIPGNGETSCIKDTVAADESKRFYRVVTVP